MPLMLGTAILVVVRHSRVWLSPHRIGEIMESRNHRIPRDGRDQQGSLSPADVAQVRRGQEHVGKPCQANRGVQTRAEEKVCSGWCQKSHRTYRFVCVYNTPGMSKHSLHECHHPTEVGPQPPSSEPCPVCAGRPLPLSRWTDRRTAWPCVLLSVALPSQSAS